MPQETAEGTYSAYDTIEKILYEAQKTNKNIFGELALQDFGDDEPDAPAEPASSEPPTEAPEDTPNV